MIKLLQQLIFENEENFYIFKSKFKKFRKRSIFEDCKNSLCNRKIKEIEISKFMIHKKVDEKYLEKVHCK